MNRKPVQSVNITCSNDTNQIVTFIRMNSDPIEVIVVKDDPYQRVIADFNHSEEVDNISKQIFEMPQVLEVSY